MREAACWMLLFLFLPLSAWGNETWGAKMFPKKRHAFGRVPLRSDAAFDFEFENIYEQEVRVVGVYSSCTCTTVSCPVKSLLSWEKGRVHAKLNTGGQHLGDVGATLRVILETTVDGKTGRDEVQLEVKGHIRPDVLITPGSVEFGTVAEGESVSRNLRLEYTGNGAWELTRILRDNPYIHARAVEARRTASEVVYDITVTLKKEAPIGYIKDVLRFVTNETAAGGQHPTSLFLPVQGAVAAPLHAKPSPFLIGVLNSGENVTKSVVVRNEMPFRITGVTADDKRFRFTFSEEESSVHLISVLFASRKSDTEEKLVKKIFVHTDLKEQEPIVLDAQGYLTVNK